MDQDPAQKSDGGKSIGAVLEAGRAVGGPGQVRRGPEEGLRHRRADNTNGTSGRHNAGNEVKTRGKSAQGRAE